MSSISLVLTWEAMMVRISFFSLWDSLYLFKTEISIFRVIVALLWRSISHGCYKIYEALILLLAGIKQREIRFLAVALMSLGIITFLFMIFFIIYQSSSP